MPELFEREKPTTQDLMKYNQKMHIIQSDLLDRLWGGWREYEPIQEVLDDLIDILQRYKEL